MPTVRDDCQGCNTVGAFEGNSWHALSCMPQSGAAMTARHNLVVSIIARFCHHILIPVRTEPGGLCHDNSKRPDIQADLPDRTLLSDVTITHPTSKSWKKLSVTRTIEAVGDRQEAEKEEKYNEMARAIDMEFNAIVLYTYGGLHRSALKYIDALAAALDPAICLLSRDEFKRSLKQHIAIAVQRGTADIMIQDVGLTRAREYSQWSRGRAKRQSQLWANTGLDSHCDARRTQTPRRARNAAQGWLAATWPTRIAVIAAAHHSTEMMG